MPLFSRSGHSSLQTPATGPHSGRGRTPSRGPAPQTRPSGANPTAQVGGLHIYDQSNRTDVSPPRETPVEPNTPLFRAVATVIHLGLSLLETPPGKEGLVRIGCGLIQERENRNHIYEDRLENMMWWVELFLARLRGSFPALVLTNRMGGEGQALRSNWASGGLNMRQYDPKDAGILKLNKLIMQNLVRAGEAAINNRQPREAQFAAYENFMFIMAITVAHEVVHLFVGYLTGRELPNTPRRVSYIPSVYNKLQDDGTEMGESGRAWEGYVFGGIVETAEDRANPLGAYQAGTLWLIDERKQVRRIDRSSVKQILNEDFAFPLRTTGPAISLAEMDRNYRMMKTVREPLLSSALVQILNRDRPTRTIRADIVRRYTIMAPQNVRDREFIRLRQAMREPRFLFVAA
ncbi:hypothetical protein F4802DRAFT_569693 [Xylaria palmicola]|nr:hypothetical protein F4802DRAFT_569693 [Xylaria palmicola]